MVYEKNGYVRLERELIKRKTKAMKELEEEFKDAQLSFNIKTIYRMQVHNFNSDENWVLHKTYYEVSYFDNSNEEHILKFYVRKGNTSLKMIFLIALHNGGDEKECPTI